MKQQWCCGKFRFSLANLQSYRISSYYSETTGRLRFYHKDEATDFNAVIENTDNFKSFKLLGNY